MDQPANQYETSEIGEKLLVAPTQFWYARPSSARYSMRFAGGQFTEEPPSALTMISDDCDPPLVHIYVSNSALQHYRIPGNTGIASVRDLCVYALICFSRYDAAELADAIGRGGAPSHVASLRLAGSLEKQDGWRSSRDVHVFGLKLPTDVWIATAWRGNVGGEFELASLKADDLVGIQPPRLLS